MKQQDVLIAGLVVSKAGRDKGRNFLVVGMEGEAYVLLADGDLRKLHRPKRKKRKHVHVTPFAAEGLRKRLVEGDRVFDHEIRQAIEALAAKRGGLQRVSPQ